MSFLVHELLSYLFTEFMSCCVTYLVSHKVKYFVLNFDIFSFGVCHGTGKGQRMGVCGVAKKLFKLSQASFILVHANATAQIIVKIGKPFGWLGATKQHNYCSKFFFFRSLLAQLSFLINNSGPCEDTVQQLNLEKVEP